MYGSARVVGERPVGFPAALCFPSAPAVIPKDASWDPLFDKWVQWSTNFTNLIQPQNRPRQTGSAIVVPDFKEQSIRFGTISRMNSFLSDSERVNLLLELGLVDVTGGQALVVWNPVLKISEGKDLASAVSYASKISAEEPKGAIPFSGGGAFIVKTDKSLVVVKGVSYSEELEIAANAVKTKPKGSDVAKKGD
jgi:hypothetical protein